MKDFRGIMTAMRCVFVASMDDGVHAYNIMMTSPQA